MKVLTRIFRTKRDRIRGEERDFTAVSRESFKKLEVTLGWAAVTMGEKIIIYRILVGTPREKDPHGTKRMIYEDNIKMNLTKLGCGE
jgi:hypothetical protein